MKDFTTMEKLQMKVSATYGSVLKFGSHVLVTDAHYRGGFTANVMNLRGKRYDRRLKMQNCG